MNKIFKVIWNHATQSWVAVSEFTKAHGKTKSVKLSAVAVAIATVAGTAHAATAEPLGGGLTSYSEPDLKRLVISTGGEPAGANDVNRGESLYIGDGTGVARPGSIRIGMNIKSDAATGNNRDLLIGNNVSTGGGGIDSLATIVGHSTYGAGPSVAVGYMAQADILSAAGAAGSEHGGVAIGAFSHIGGNINGGTAIGSLSMALASRNVSIGVGSGAQVKFIDGKGGEVIFGEANGDSAISIGDYTAARSQGAIAIGNNATTGIQRSTRYEDVSAYDSVALGNASAALSSYSIAIGSRAQASVYDTADIERIEADIKKQDALIADFDAQIAEWKAQDIIIEDGRPFAGGPESHITPAQHDQVNAVLSNKERAKIVKERLQRDLTLLKNAIATNKKRENAIAIGNQSKALGLNDIAIGNASSVTGLDSIAIGNSNNVTGNNSIAIGNSSVVSGNTSIAVGHKNTVTGNNSGAFGDPNFVTSDNSYAIGNNNTVNSANTFVLGNSIGQGTRNVNLTGNTLENSVYLGTDSEAAAGQVGDERTGSAGISQATATRGGGNTQTAGTGTYKGTTLVTDFVNSALNDTGFDLAETKSGFQYATTDGDPAGQQVGEYAGNSAVGVVTVGASGAGTAAGNHRRIVNVAAGLVTSTSTDAVNGSQLYAAMVQASRPISFTGNSNQDTNNDGTEQLLGSNLRIIGATTAAADARDNSKETRDGEYKAKNIATVVSNGEVQIQFADNPEFKAVDLEDTIVPDSSAMTSGGAPTAPNLLNKAVSLGDVLNTGWNLAVEGKAADLVRPYDTVNFIGEGVTITEEADSTTSRTNIKFKVEQPTAGTFKADENGSLAPTDAAEGNKLASVQGVSDAVNNSYWNINTSQDGENEAKVGDGKVNPSNNVVFNGVGAVKVAAGTTDEGKYTVDFSVETDDTTVEVKDGKIAAKTSTLAAAPTDNPAAPTAGTILAGDNPTALTTAQNVADMINAAAWKATSAATAAGTNEGTSVELVNAGDTVTFEADSGVKIVQDAGKFTFSVKTDGTTTEINDKGEIVAKAPETAPLTNADNKVTTPTGADANKLATAGDVANAINNSGFTLKHSVTDGEDKGGAEEVINPGDVVDMVAGKNLSVQQEANGRIIYATKDKVEFTEVKVGGDVANNPITIGTNPAGENVISGLSNTLAPLNVNPAETKAPTFDDAKLGSAATLSDVLNAGWNLQNNGEAKDFVKPYDTVNFANGTGTTAVVEVKADGTIADVKYDIKVDNTTTRINPETGELEAIQPTAGTFKADENGSLAPTDATEGNKLASVQGVSDAVNNSYWNINTSQDGENEAKVGDGKVNPSNNVVFNGVGAVKVAAGTTDEGKYTVDFSVETDDTTVEVKDGKIAAKTSTLAAAPTDNPAAPTAGTILAGDNPTALTTAQNVADMINAAAWKATSAATAAGTNEGTSVELVNAGDTVTFEADSGVKIVQDAGKFTFSVKTDGTTTEINDKGEIVAKAPETAPLTNADNKVTTPTGADANKLATAGDVANAINNSGFTLKHSVTDGEDKGGAEEVINPGDVVDMVAGKNLSVQQEANGRIIYATKDKVEFTEVKVGGDVANNPITIGTNPAGENVISGLTNTLAPLNTNPAETKAPTFDDVKLGSAATLSDVLNAGWNLQNNGEAKDFVKPYDTVNFVDGKGTKAVVEVKADGTIADVKFDVDVASLVAPITNNENGSVTGPANSTELADALTEAEEALAALPADATPEEKAAAEKAVQDAKDAVTNAGNALATAQNVADAINASGWNATSGKVGTGEVEGTTNELINPSETVTFQAGDNMMLKQEGNVFTYSVNPNPVFNNVTANQVTVGGTPATDNAPAKAPIVIGTNPEGKNEITGLDTTLPVPAETATKPADINESKAATLGDVLNAGWNLTENGEARDVVTPYNTVNFVDGAGTKVTVTTDGETSNVKIDIAAASVTGNTDGSVTGPANSTELADALKAAEDALAALPETATPEEKAAAEKAVQDAKDAVTNAGNALATAQNVADAINNSGFTLKHSATDGEDLGGEEELINPGDVVEMIAGKNLSVKQEADGKITYATKDKVEFTEVKVGGDVANNPITIGTNPAGENVISGLTNTLAPLNTNPAETKAPTFDDVKLGSAATLSDVLNAGWNLQNNGEAKDFVKPYDTVNFVDGAGTTATVEVNADGTIADVKFDVNVDDNTIKIVDGKLTAVQPDTLVNGDKVGGNVNFVDSDTVTAAPGDNPGDIKFNVNTASITPVTEGDKAGSVTGPVTPALTDALKAAQDELAALPADASEEVKQAAADKVAAAQNAVNKAGNAVATAQNVADAINASGWNATSGKVGTGVVSGTTKELINPSETVTFNAGDNLVLEQNGNEFTYSLNKDININSANIGGNGTDVAAPDYKAPITIGTVGTGPDAKNVISGLDHNLPVTSSVQDGDISPTKAQNIDLGAVNQNNAATVGDVLNAGWNLQANGKAKDFVRPYDTVNFANSDTITVAEPETDGTTTTLKLEANTSPLTNAANGTVETPANPNALATAGDVANAINNSGFDVKADVADASSELAVGGKAGVAKDTGNGRVNPGSTVNVKAGRNIEIERNGKDVTIATAKDPVFENVTTSGLVVTPNSKVDMGGNRVTNVAKGVDPTDAVNVAQLKDEIGAAVAPIHNRINKVNKDLRAGIAGANAAAGLPQVYIPGKSMVAASAGTFKGQSAVAVGYSRASDNGKLILKLQGNANTRGDVGGSIGVGYQW